MIYERVQQTSTTSGTGTLSMTGTVNGRRTFVGQVGTGNQCYYAIEDSGGVDWEIGIGAVTSGSPDTLTRATVIASSNSNALVAFSSAAKNVWIPSTAELMGSMNGRLVFGTTGGTSTAYTLTPRPALRALTDGAVVRAKMHVASGATPTLAVSGLTAKGIYRSATSVVVANALMLDNDYTFTYDSALNAAAGGWLLQDGMQGVTSIATETHTGANRGTKAQLRAIPNTTAVDQMELEAQAGVWLANATGSAKGLGTLNAVNYFVGGWNLTGVQTLSFGTSLAWAINTAPIARVTLTGNVTSGFSAPTSLTTDTFCALMIIQDGTGGRTIASWNAAFKFAGGTAPTLSTGASKRDIFSFWCDGTNLYETGRVLNL